jgi:hypothetical protein
MAAYTIAAQLGGPVLAVCAGPRGYRLAFIGGGRFEPVPVSDGLSWDEACALYRAATSSLGALTEASP